jgi:hypothetical protein
MLKGTKCRDRESNSLSVVSIHDYEHPEALGRHHGYLVERMLNNGRCKGCKNDEAVKNLSKRLDGENLFVIGK